MAKNKGTKTPADSVTDVEQALGKACEAAGRLKPKNAALYWALTAQTLVLTEIRDMMQEANKDDSRATVPEQATSDKNTGRPADSPEKPETQEKTEAQEKTGSQEKGGTSSSTTTTRTSRRRSESGSGNRGKTATTSKSSPSTSSSSSSAGNSRSGASSPKGGSSADA